MKAASGGRAVTRVAPALRCGRSGPEVGAQLPRLHPQPELGQAAVAEVGALGAVGRGRQLAVEEDGDAEAADLGGDVAGGCAGGVAIGGVEPDERADIEGADRRVQPRGSADMSIASIAAAAPAASASDERLRPRRRG